MSFIPETETKYAFTKFSAYVAAKKPSLLSIISQLIWVFICFSGILLSIMLFFMHDSGLPVWTIIFMLGMFLLITIFSYWALQSRIKKRKRIKNYFMAFGENKFHYHMPDDDFTIDGSAIICFKFSFYNAGQAQSWLSVLYNDDQGKEQQKKLDYYSFPRKIGNSELADWLNLELDKSKKSN
jgi:hypothetical protein